MAQQPAANTTRDEIDFIFGQRRIFLPERTPQGPASSQEVREWTGQHIRGYRRIRAEQATLATEAATRDLTQEAINREEQRLDTELESIEAKITGGLREGLRQKCQEALSRYAVIQIVTDYYLLIQNCGREFHFLPVHQHRRRTGFTPSRHCPTIPRDKRLYDV